MKKALRILTALTLGLVGTFVLLEVVLRIASAFVADSRAGNAGASLVLAQGDSNVFGLYLPKEHAWPAQLEVLLERAGVEQRRVVNRGVPGKASWIVLDELGQDLEDYTPGAVAMLVGINDRLATRPELTETGFETSFVDRLRTVRMFRVLVARLAEEEREDAETAGPAANGDQHYWVPPEAIRDVGDETREIHFEDRAGVARPFEIAAGLPEPAEYQGWIAEDLALASELASSRGALPLVIVYPSERAPYDKINVGIEQAAERSGARLVDPRPHFHEAFGIVPESALLYPDGHSTKLGYSVIARLVLAALVDEGLIEADLSDPFVADPLAEVRAWTPPALEVEPWCEGGVLRGVVARYAPGVGALLLVARAGDEENPLALRVKKRGLVELVDTTGPNTVALPLARDDVLALSMRGQPVPPVGFDGEGVAHLPLPEGVPTDGPLVGVAMVLAPGQRIPAVVGPFELRCP